MAHRLLVIEDDDALEAAGVCATLSRDAEFRCTQLPWAAAVPERLRSSDAHGIVAVAEGSRVLDLFHSLRANPIAKPTLAVLSQCTSETVAGTVSQTADDFLYSPIRPDELRHRLIRLLGPPRGDCDVVRERLIQEMGLMQLVGRDPEFVKALEQIPRFAHSGMPVLITGETGTGKELCARAIHFLSKRRDCPFIAVDCGALPDHLVENELFGHARGAFTDAHRDQRGLIAMAEGGTLFLDEVDALSLVAQAKLLRFLQDHTFRPLGADRFARADVNIIAATNRDLEKCVREKQFRSDLYFRLNVLRLHLPPLRERRGDVGLLVTHFIEERRASSMDRTPRSLCPSAARMLALYDWPGNVRELANVVQRALVLCDGAQILRRHIALPDAPAAAEPAACGDFRTSRTAAVEAFERRYVEDLLRKHDGNVTQAAREARQDRRDFGRLVKKYSIVRRGL